MTPELRQAASETEAQQAIEGLQAIESSRSLLSRSLDESQQHSIVIDSDDQRTCIWKRDPRRMDVRGVDTRVTKRRKAKQNRKT